MMKNPYYNWRQSKAVAVVVAAFSLLQEQSNGQYTLVVVSWDFPFSLLSGQTFFLCCSSVCFTCSNGNSSSSFYFKNKI